MNTVKVVKVTSNNRVCLIYLPKQVVAQLGLIKGVYLKLVVDGKKVILEPIK
jgi:bifunctional DNA-binding transcriptional regulator/antitoxin component of YhaV-PrlF toxin-antitoxin module